MATTQDDIRRWLLQGKEEGATHVIVVCDTFDWSDYPVPVQSGEQVREQVAKYDSKEMQSSLSPLD